MGMPVTLIGEAVFARCLSAIKAERVEASKVLSGPQIERLEGDKQQFIDDLEQALYASKIVSCVVPSSCKDDYRQCAQICARLHAHARSCQGIQVDPQQWCANLSKGSVSSCRLRAQLVLH